MTWETVAWAGTGMVYSIGCGGVAMVAYLFGWWAGRRKGRREGLGMARTLLHAEMEALAQVREAQAQAKGDFGVIPRDGDLSKALSNFYSTMTNMGAKR